MLDMEPGGFGTYFVNEDPITVGGTYTYPINWWTNGDIGRIIFKRAFGYGSLVDMHITYIGFVYE
jgi:hypothetical protein